MSGKYNFPKLQKIILRNFSLYTKNKQIQIIDEEIYDGVFCLAGANGLGKTTFLNAINFGYTGIVLEPNREVFSPGEIVKENKKYTTKYFKGRIHASDEKVAEVELHFKINELYFRIIRGFFELNQLRGLEIYQIIENKKIPKIDTSSMSPTELNKEYEKQIAKAVDIKNFDFFMFLQLYVFTFDESRRMIFWDDRASLHTLSIAFNTDLADTEEIISLKRKMEKHESDGRNKRWQATQIKNKIDHLLKDKEIVSDTKATLEEYENIFAEYERTTNAYNNTEIEYQTLLKNQSYLNAEILQLKIEHGKLFSKYSQPRSILLNNVFVKMSMDNKECCICHAKSEQIHTTIQNNLYKDHCPLCGTTIDEDSKNDQAVLLTQIQNHDQYIADKTTALEKTTLEINTKKAELEKVAYELKEVQQLKNEFEYSHPLVIQQTSGSSIDMLINEYQKQYEILDFESKEEYKIRDQIKLSFIQLQTKISNAYKEAELDFVPIFKKFAKSFIGLDLDISFEKSAQMMKLVLELQSTARTAHFQLSESQRFFIDIALRMALAVYLSKKNNEATILIDTPEGSLDIAYENRVGQMFADFVEKNQHLIITANINASQLLLSLAKRCGHKKMTFKRMLDWTDLSIIQKEGESLFEEVYLRIENAMKEKDNAVRS
ncbi:MAG: AAA family ATPase [Sulfurovaceae bacterium]|nr:AAA family ATPase [Sulfurovaceae bacterium]